MTKVTLNKQQFIDFYSSTDSYETFQEQLEKDGTVISIANIKAMLKSIGLEPKNRKRGARITFEFEEVPTQVFDMEEVNQELV